MLVLNELLDTAKTKNNIPSDYQLSDYLGVTKQSISKYRKGYGLISNTTAIRLAELCSLKPELVIASICAQRAETTEEKTIWQHFYKMAAAAAIAGVAVSASVSAPISNAEASPLLVNASHEYRAATIDNVGTSNNVYYVKLCARAISHVRALLQSFGQCFPTPVQLAFC